PVEKRLVRYKISSEIGINCRPGALTGLLFPRRLRKEVAADVGPAGSKPRPSPRKRDSCKERRVPLRLQPDMKDAPRFEFLQELHHQLFFLAVSPKLTRGAQINRQPMRERDRHRDFKTVVRKM